MGYTMLEHVLPLKAGENYKYSLEGAALTFLRDRCEALRFDATMEAGC